MHLLLLGLRYTVSITDYILKRRYSKVTSIWEEFQVISSESYWKSIWIINTNYSFPTDIKYISDMDIKIIAGIVLTAVIAIALFYSSVKEARKSPD